MRERGLMFSGAMVRGVLADVDPKTQTRRVCRLPRGPEAQPWQQPAERELPSPYGEVGDRLWVRETWGAPDADHPRVVNGRKPAPGDRIVYRANLADAEQWRPGHPGCGDFVWRPSILMPRWASRITLEITGRRVERLHDITDEDIRAEGVTVEAVRALLGRDTVDLGIVSANGRRDPRSVVATPIADLSLRELWQVGWTAINGAESWASNPFVRVIRFRRVEATS